jgi:hypothetical protein
MKTRKSIKLKTGAVLPAGLPVLFCRDNPRLCMVEGLDRPYRVRVTSAFKCPSFRKLEEAMMDGDCRSIAGHVVEPDGWDYEGTPSWLLALGVI